LASWDLQLAEPPVTLSADRAAYVLDLFDAAPAGITIDYGDGAPLAVPAGRNATAIATLKARAMPARVICNVSAGTIRLTDPDAPKFPGFSASPPNRPTPPAAGSVIGWSTSTTSAAERFLDLRGSARDRLEPLIARRLEIAKLAGCDGVLVRRLDTILDQGTSSVVHGFGDVSIADTDAWIRLVADLAHARALAVGIAIYDQLSGLATQSHDFFFLDRCGEDNACDLGRGWIAANKAVLAVDYTKDVEGTPNRPEIVCCRQKRSALDGIIKDSERPNEISTLCAPVVCN
jgi:hypothetical protein